MTATEREQTVRAVTDKDREVQGKGGSEMKRLADRQQTEGKEMNTRRGRGVGVGADMHAEGRQRRRKRGE